MMGETSLETLPKNNMIQDMINSDNMNSTDSIIPSIFKTVCIFVVFFFYGQKSVTGLTVRENNQLYEILG